MPLLADSSGGKDFVPVTEGLHPGVCVGLYDLGTHFNEKFSKSQRKCVLVHEITDERIEFEKDGELHDMPRVISKTYTLSLHPRSHLRKHIESWAGRTLKDNEMPFDLLKLLGVNNTIQVLHNAVGDRTYANIASILPVMAGVKKVKPEMPVRHFSFDTDTRIPEGTPDWIADQIRAADEWGAGVAQEAEMEKETQYTSEGEEDDSIPF